MKMYNEIDYSELQFETVTTNKKKTYINIECGFDIESTSTYIHEEKVAFMYEWTFGLKDKNFICYGRTWEQFIELCEKLQKHFQLSEDRILVCYIHNFKFEFQFMRKYFEWVNVFSTDERNPIKALCTYGIEFRDSLILSGYSLAKTAENLQFHKVDKLVGDLDYSLVRTADTVLTEKELAYCEHDVLIILYYINEQIKQYGNITKIPLTNTGRVRQFVRENCYYNSKSSNKRNKGKFLKYRELMKELVITPEEYAILKRAFQGGFTHANVKYVKQVLNNVSSIDFTSSYPAVMLSEKFPMGQGIKTEIKSVEELKKYLDKYCLVFDVEFHGLRSKFFNDNYISEDKCFKGSLKNAIVNNGRIFSADKLITTVTDIDFGIIRSCYTWDYMKIDNVYRYCKGYLPKDIILSILELYEKKTTLKGVEGMEVEYQNAKGMLNSVYGMCVTDIVRDEITYLDEWGKEPADKEKQIQKYNDSFNRFLYYPWGVWITAYARRNLWLGIKAINDDYVYSDTDSVKFLNFDKHKEFIESYNQMIEHKLVKMCEHYSIDLDKLKPKTIKGKEKMIGVWDYEGTYTRFKTLGAKRYLVEEDGKLQITIAGLSKQDGVGYMLDHCEHDHSKVFDMFNFGMVIPADRTGKNGKEYVDTEKEFYVLDYQGNESFVSTKSGVHLEPVSYTLEEYLEYGQFIRNFIEGRIFKGVSSDV